MLRREVGAASSNEAEIDPAARSHTSAGADVVVPVYGAHDEFARCLDSLLRHTDLRRHGLVAVLDGPGQERAADVLARARQQAGASVRVLQNEARRGFVASANHGMRSSTRDVVLLNSDTEVTPRWLDKLQAAAYSAPEVATATPFCNDATLVSLPEPFAVNRLPAGHDADSFARLVERAAARTYPRLPTGVGVCLYVKRRALEAVGFLDEQAFGLGYGEENDFCCRALAAGFVHVLDDATFVYHAGHRSFGRERRALMRRGARRLGRRHPGYFPAVAAFMRADPLGEARRRVEAALRPGARSARAPAPRVMHVVHGWPPFSTGGTEQYAAWLARAQAQRHPVAVYARVSDPARDDGEVDELRDAGVRVRLVVNGFRARDPLARNALRHARIERDFAGWLADWRPDLVHVHHLAGHSLGLTGVVARRGLPLVMQLQDWWPLCARSNLLLPDRRLCSGPGLVRCARCFTLTRLPPWGLPNLALHALRRALAAAAVRRAHAFVAGSRFVAETWRDLGLLRPGDRLHVLPYGVPLAEPGAAGTRPRSDPRPPLRFGVVGTLMPHKGAHVAVAAFRDVDPALATLDLWGAENEAPDYVRELRAAAGPAVRLRGAFPEVDKATVLASLDALVVPSVGLESFGLAAYEALAAGLPVLASRLGALAQLVEDGGALGFTAGDPLELEAHVRALAAEPARLVALRAAAPAPKSVAAHAAEIDALYETLLPR